MADRDIPAPLERDLVTSGARVSASGEMAMERPTSSERLEIRSYPLPMGGARLGDGRHISYRNGPHRDRRLAEVERRRRVA